PRRALGYPRRICCVGRARASQRLSVESYREAIFEGRLVNLDSWIWPVLLAPIIGSFIGVVVLRAPRARTILFGRSACVFCDHRLAPRDLIPVISWTATRGRCRYCGKPTGVFYPFIELAALALAAWSALTFTGWLVWASCLLGWSLLALAAI